MLAALLLPASVLKLIDNSGRLNELNALSGKDYSHLIKWIVKKHRLSEHATESLLDKFEKYTLKSNEELLQMDDEDLIVLLLLMMDS